MNGNRGLVIGIGVVVLVIILGVFWWLGRGEQEVVSNTNTEVGASSSGGVEGTTGTDTTASSTGTTSTASGATAPKYERLDSTKMTAASLIATLPDASRFAALVSATGQSATLNRSGNMTVFVPTDGAFNLVAPKTLSSMTTAQKKRLVQYHVVSTRAIDLG